MTLWEQCIHHLSNELQDQDINLWIRPLQCVETDNCLQFYAPNQYILNWAKKNIEPKLNRFLNLRFPDRQLQTKFVIGNIPPSKPAPTTPAKSQTTPDRIDNSQNQPEANHKNLRLEKKFTFDDFVEGDCNQLAFKASKQVADGYGYYNPLYICGGTGVGKTHLMQAIGNSITKKQANKKMYCVSGETFVRDMVWAIQNGTIDKFKLGYRQCETLMIDDIHFLAGKERSQEEFFHTFNEILSGGHQIIVTSHSYPQEIEGLQDRIKSRLGGGLVVSLKPPNKNTRKNILQKKAAIQKIPLPEPVAEYLADLINEDVRGLEGAFNRVALYASYQNSAITIDLIKEALNEYHASLYQQINIEQIKTRVAEHYKIKIQDIASGRRLRSLTRPRQIAMALSRELTEQSFQDIAEAFGKKDHGSVHYACKQVKQWLHDNENTAEEYEILRNQLRA